MISAIPTGKRDGFGCEFVIPPSFNSFESDQKRQEYIESIIPHRGYWVVVYCGALPAAILNERRTGSQYTPEQRADSWRKFSIEELPYVREKIIGLEVLITHKDNTARSGTSRGNRSYGKVVESRVSANGTKLDALIRPFTTPSPETISLCYKLEFGLMQGVSLQHNRSGVYYQLCELTICHLGLIPGTTVYGCVNIPDGMYSIKGQEPQVYELPQFVRSVASSDSFIDDRSHAWNKLPQLAMVVKQHKQATRGNKSQMGPKNRRNNQLVHGIYVFCSSASQASSKKGTPTNCGCFFGYFFFSHNMHCVSRSY